jgi:hypothetical protein
MPDAYNAFSAVEHVHKHFFVKFVFEARVTIHRPPEFKGAKSVNDSFSIQSLGLVVLQHKAK